MRVLMAIAVVLLATSAAEAQYSFEYNGRIIRIDPDRGTVSIPGVFDNTPRKSRRARAEQGRARQPTNIDSSAPEQTAPAASVPATGPAAAPATPAPAASAATTNTAEPASTAPSETAAIPPAPTAASETPSPAQPQPADTATTPALAPPAAAAAPAPPAVPKSAETVPTANPPPAAAPRDPHSPIGVWLTEEKEGKVRIEPCGANLCGYSVDTKSNENSEQVLINMKQGKDQKWSGRILDPNTGSTYDSTIGLIGANALRVQGCAFNGMFCGGQTWTRIN